MTKPVQPILLPVDVVFHIHRLLGGDARLEAMVLQYIGFKWGAKNLLFLPLDVATGVIRRPADFIRDVKQHCAPEMKF